MAATAFPQARSAAHDAPPVPPPDRPTGSYALLSGVFASVFGGGLIAGRDRLPERFAAGDLALMAIGTHKLSRLLTKQRVTATIRAPFTEDQGNAGYSEVDERARGRGLQRAIGELLTCPYCLDQWIAGGFVAGMVVAPRATRTVASMFTVVAGADALQLGYRALQRRT